MAAFGASRFLAKGWVETLYVSPTYHLTYAGFDWIAPLPSFWMHAHMVLLAALGICIAIGWHYRIAMAAYAVAFTYTELIDAALYLNHYWFISVASFVLIFVPLNNTWSFDARSGRTSITGWTPTWALWLIRGQLAVVYIFAGIAKLQNDWMFNALPMRLWLADRTHLPVVGQFLDEPWVAYAASWGGAAFDCTIVGWLLWNKSRPYAYLAVIGFHTITGILFQIGMFPWLMIASTLVFFPPDWPTKVLRGITGRRFEAPPRPQNQWHSTRIALPLIIALVVFNLAMPLRHLAYPGDVRWTEEGYFGAWRVMLTEKAGVAQFQVRDPKTGAEWDLPLDSVLTDWQARQAAIRPDLLLTAARLVKKDFAAKDIHNVEVRADVFTSFNGRPNQRMIDETVDLTKVSRAPGHKTFVLPLENANS